MEKIQSQITFLYYQDIEQAASFFQQVLGLEPVEDQQWAKIYRLSGNAFLGAVSGEQGFHQVQDQSAVLITLVVDDVRWWYEHLKSHGVKLLSELQHREEIQIRCFFFEDPGGYSYEIQQFLKPDLINIFHPGG
jgi:predicted enzyme related to lactoylglutathione lyase